MEAFKIEILNPKALQLIKGMEDLKLIKVSEDPASKLKAYLKKTRSKASNDGFMDVVTKLRNKAKKNPPSLDEITKIVEEVRAKRYAKKGK